MQGGVANGVVRAFQAQRHASHPLSDYPGWPFPTRLLNNKPARPPAYKRAIHNINLIVKLVGRKGRPIAEDFLDRSLRQLTCVIRGGPAANNGPIA